MSTEVYRFGPFELDAASRRLLRDRQPIDLPERHADVLRLLVSEAGHVVAKEVIIARVWQDTAVTDNSIERAIWNLRRALGDQPDGTPHIETRPRQGYRFAAPVERGASKPSDAALDAVAAPYHAFIEGLAALETLDPGAVSRARAAFAAALGVKRHHAATHVGMANACLLSYESTRADVAPDDAALRLADHHAREARQLDPASGEAWATLAVVLNRSGRAAEAIAAVRQAIELEPTVWQHHLRHAVVSWGDERLRAAQRVLARCPDLPLAHWLIATVFIARQAFDTALDHVRAGCAAQDAQHAERRRFHAIGLHLQHGLLLLARGAHDEALDQFTREIRACDQPQVYARECAANAAYACGALHLRCGRAEEAETALRAALARVPGHPCATLALATLTPLDASSSILRPPCAGTDSAGGADRPDTINAAMVHAVALALAGRHDEAAQVCGRTLAQATPSQAGWLLPVEPVLHVAARRHCWTDPLATLRHGAA